MTPGEILVSIINDKSKLIVLVNYEFEDEIRYIVFNTINKTFYAIYPYGKDKIIELT